MPSRKHQPVLTALESHPAHVTIRGASAPDEAKTARRAGAPWIAAAAVMVLAALSNAGCGSASQRSASGAVVSRTSTTSSSKSATAPTVQTICTSRANLALERVLGAAPSLRASVANSDYPQCSFRARLRGRVVTVTAEVDTETSAYAVLERTIVEAAQVFTPQRLSPAPQHVDGLGLDASWFPEEQHLMTTDAVRLIIVTIDWPKASTARKVALAVAVARPYLGHLEPQLARGPAP